MLEGHLASPEPLVFNLEPAALQSPEGVHREQATGQPRQGEETEDKASEVVPQRRTAARRATTVVPRLELAQPDVDADDGEDVARQSG